MRDGHRYTKYRTQFIHSSQAYFAHNNLCYPKKKVNCIPQTPSRDAVLSSSASTYTGEYYNECMASMRQTTSFLPPHPAKKTHIFP